MILRKGDQIANFKIVTAFHGEKTVEEIVHESKWTIFWVLRFLGCTLCNYDIHVISKRYQEFLQKEAQVVVVLQNKVNTITESVKKTEIPMEIICDAGCQIYDALEIQATATKADRLPKTPDGIEKLEEKRKKAKEAGFTHGVTEGREQQLPAMFIVDQQRRTVYAHYAKDSVDMPSVEEVLSIIQSLGSEM